MSTPRLCGRHMVTPPCAICMTTPARHWVVVRFEDYATGDVLAVEDSERSAWDVVAETAFEGAISRRTHYIGRETWAQSVAAESYVLAVVPVGELA